VDFGFQVCGVELGGKHEFGGMACRFCMVFLAKAAHCMVGLGNMGDGGPRSSWERERCDDFEFSDSHFHFKCGFGEKWRSSM
jgi:hypothetical protein